MTLSQGILTSADNTAFNVDAISVIEGDISRTDLDIVRAAPLAWGDDLRVTVKNTGQTRLASFDKWDVIVSYLNSGTQYSKWLDYTLSPPVNDEWQKARIGLNGPIEYFEPGILNPAEEMVALIHLDPPPDDTDGGDVSIATPNGVYTSMSFLNPGYARFTAQSENITIANTKYYELVEAAGADGAAITARADFSNNESARTLLYNADQPARPAKHIYPLIGISQIPAQTWTVFYRGYVSAGSGFPQLDNDVRFNVDILIRKANGTVEASWERAASAYVQPGEEGSWITVSGTYEFPGYTVTDQNDYLEIDFYAQTGYGPGGESGYMQLSIDDSSLPVDEQTRIEA
jgi:hypothetical protein